MYTVDLHVINRLVVLFVCLFVSCVALGKLLNLSVPQFLHLQTGFDDEDNSNHFKGFFAKE